MIPARRLSFLTPAVLVTSCATSSVTNYSVTYSAAGPAREAAAINQSAERAFRKDVTGPSEARAISVVKVFLDSIPPQITLKDNAVAIQEGESAELFGSVEIKAIWKAPSEDAEALPAIQKATYSAGANIAYCPRNEMPAFGVWRCYLVRAPD
jgi:hypothetical protein